MNNKIKMWGTALTLSGALIATAAPAASAQTYPTPCKRGEVRASGKCVKRVTALGNGRFRNNVGPRKGRVFRVVRRNGRVFHVYSKTRTTPRLVIEIR